MRPSRIPEILDIAWNARLKNQILNIRFVGPAGVGKSAIIRQWAEGMKSKYPDFQVIDKRTAYDEAPDFLGLVEIIKDADGKARSSHCLPDFWPTKGHGIIILEEIARANTSVMNCLMQMLQERMVGPFYTIPDGWMIVAADNPDGDASYDVNTLDAALANRFVPIDVEYDHNTFVNYMEKHNWCQHIQTFVRSGQWVFKEASSIGANGKYISPRTWEQVNAAHIAGAIDDPQIHRILLTSILGKEIGGALWTAIHDDAPVLAEDLIHKHASAIKRLKKHSERESYKGDKISMTVESIIRAYGGKNATKDEVNTQLMAEVAAIIPSDQALNMIKGCGMKGKDGNITTFFKDLVANHPDLAEVIKGNIKLNNTK